MSGSVAMQRCPDALYYFQEITLLHREEFGVLTPLPLTSADSSSIDRTSASISQFTIDNEKLVKLVASTICKCRVYALL